MRKHCKEVIFQNKNTVHTHVVTSHIFRANIENSNILNIFCMFKKINTRFSGLKIACLFVKYLRVHKMLS